LDKCSIVALNMENGKYTPDEDPRDRAKYQKWKSNPELAGVGFLINKETGRVFCKNFPHDLIILSIVDRQRVGLGIYLTFSSLFHHAKKRYLVVQYTFCPFKRAIEHEERDGKILFIDPGLGCFIRENLNTHCSNHFGFVYDPQMLVTWFMLNKLKCPDNLKNFGVDAYINEIPESLISPIFELHSLSVKLNQNSNPLLSNVLVQASMESRPSTSQPSGSSACEGKNFNQNDSAPDEELSCNKCIEAALICEQLIRDPKSLEILNRLGKTDDVLEGAKMYGGFVREAQLAIK